MRPLRPQEAEKKEEVETKEAEVAPAADAKDKEAAEPAAAETKEVEMKDAVEEPAAPAQKEEKAAEPEAPKEEEAAEKKDAPAEKTDDKNGTRPVSETDGTAAEEKDGKSPQVPRSLALVAPPLQSRRARPTRLARPRAPAHSLPSPRADPPPPSHFPRLPTRRSSPDASCLTPPPSSPHHLQVADLPARPVLPPLKESHLAQRMTEELEPIAMRLQEHFSVPPEGQAGMAHLIRLLCDAFEGEWDPREMCGLNELLYKAATPGQLVALGEAMPHLFRNKAKFDTLFTHAKQGGTWKLHATKLSLSRASKTVEELAPYSGALVAFVGAGTGEGKEHFTSGKATLVLFDVNPSDDEVEFCKGDDTLLPGVGRHKLVACVFPCCTRNVANVSNQMLQGYYNTMIGGRIIVADMYNGGGTHGLDECMHVLSQLAALGLVTVAEWVEVIECDGKEMKVHIVEATVMSVVDLPQDFKLQQSVQSTIELFTFGHVDAEAGEYNVINLERRESSLSHITVNHNQKTSAAREPAVYVQVAAEPPEPKEPSEPAPTKPSSPKGKKKQRCSAHASPPPKKKKRKKYIYPGSTMRTALIRTMDHTDGAGEGNAQIGQVCRGHTGVDLQARHTRFHILGIGSIHPELLSLNTSLDWIKLLILLAEKTVLLMVSQMLESHEDCILANATLRTFAIYPLGAGYAGCTSEAEREARLEKVRALARRELAGAAPAVTREGLINAEIELLTSVLNGPSGGEASLGRPRSGKKAVSFSIRAPWPGNQTWLHVTCASWAYVHIKNAEPGLKSYTQIGNQICKELNGGRPNAWGWTIEKGKREGSRPLEKPPNYDEEVAARNSQQLKAIGKRKGATR